VIFGIGTDIVRVSRMHENLARFGERFARRILAEQEWEAFLASARPAHFLAKRFAAKEAAVKAMGTGFRDGITLKQIAVGHAPGGRPLLRFSEQAEAFLHRNGVGEAHLSLSDEEAYAVAFVTLQYGTSDRERTFT